MHSGPLPAVKACLPSGDSASFLAHYHEGTLVGVFDLPRRHFTLNLDASASKRPHFSVPKFPIVDQSRYEDYTPALPTIRASRTTLQSFRLHTEQMLP